MNLISWPKVCRKVREWISVRQREVYILWRAGKWCMACVLSRVWIRDSVDHSPPGFSVHGISLTRILEWVVISFSRGSSWHKGGTRVSSFPAEPPGKTRVHESTVWRLWVGGALGGHAKTWTMFIDDLD